MSSLGHTVGHVEVETVRDDELPAGVLVLPTAVFLLQAADPLHPDVGVAVAALGLADVGEHQVRLHLRGDGDNPGDGGVRLHSHWPTGSSQKDGGVFL